MSSKFYNFLIRNIVFFEAISHFSVFLQAWKIFDQEDGSQISLSAYTIRLFMSFLWLAFAILQNNYVAKTGETIEIIGILFVISLVIFFKDPLNKRLDYPDKKLLKEDPNSVIKKYSPETYNGNNVAYFLINKPTVGNRMEVVPEVLN